MAELMIPPNAGNAVLRWTELDSGREFSSTMGYSRGVSGSADPTVQANRFYTSATESGSISDADQMNPNWRFEGVSTYFNEGGTLVGGESTGPPVLGTHVDSGVPLPNSIAVVAQKRTGRVGRKYRGRMFLPTFKLMSLSVDTAGNIESSRLASIQGNVNVFYLSLDDTSELAPALLHSAEGAVTLLTSMVVAGKIGIQRRRTA